MMNKPKVSVIIPVFNTGCFLARCLDSILDQTLSDIEVICINDGSKDDSKEILENYAKKDYRIKNIHLQKNYGSSFARNRGIKISIGKTIGFVDSDDYISKNFYEDLYINFEETNADIVKGKRKVLDLEGQWHNEDIENKILKNKYKFDYQFSTAIYDQNFIKSNNIYFPNGIVAEDVGFLLKAIYRANKIDLCSTAYYYYERRKNSATLSPMILKKIIDEINVYKAVLFFCNQRYDKNEYIKICFVIFEKLNLLLKIYRNNNLIDRYFQLTDNLGKLWSILHIDFKFFIKKLININLDLLINNYTIEEWEEFLHKVILYNKLVLKMRYNISIND